VVGLLVAKLVHKLLRRALRRFIAKEALVSTISSVVFILILVFVVALALEQIGVQGIVVRRIIFGATMAIILLVMVFRPYLPSLPFKVGNFVKIGELLGRVEATTLMHTRLKTVDGKTVFLPNTQILKEAVINYYFTPTRRVEVDVGIGYDQDLLKAKQVMESLMMKTPEYSKPRGRLSMWSILRRVVWNSPRGAGWRTRSTGRPSAICWRKPSCVSTSKAS